MKRIFGAVDRGYLVRAYLISTVIMVGWMIWANANFRFPTAFDFFFIPAAAVLFPFAKLSWDEVRNLILGETLIVFNAVFLYGAKIVINVLLWIFSPIIAPLGIIYLAFRTRAPRSNVHPDQS
ncbi:hypothetical protein [Roseovarius sp. THAF27]|uniref:hypothetical protein n=1 Tax=Roseovarius sp. THAF27 TaxID=2587850 RepID=UPI001C12BC47|nr:hypothetical protein [Roseovarius sp. THAF27]